MYLIFMSTNNITIIFLSLIMLVIIFLTYFMKDWHAHEGCLELTVHTSCCGYLPMAELTDLWHTHRQALINTIGEVTEYFIFNILIVKLKSIFIFILYAVIKHTCTSIDYGYLICIAYLFKSTYLLMLFIMFPGSLRT